VYVKGHEKQTWNSHVELAFGRWVRTHVYRDLGCSLEDMESLINLLLILCDVDNMLRIARYKMY